MKPTFATTGYLLAFALLATAAQTRPDLSACGRPSGAQAAYPPPLPPPPPGGGPPPHRLPENCVHDDRAVRDRAEGGQTGQIEGRETVYTFVYNLNGTESVNQMGPLVFRTKATWDGAALVLSSVISTGGDTRTFGESKEIYRLRERRADRGDYATDARRHIHKQGRQQEGVSYATSLNSSLYPTPTLPPWRARPEPRP